MFTLFILLVTMSVALFRYCLRRTHTYECKNKHTQHDDTASRQMQVSWVALTTRYLLVPSVSVNRSSTRWLLQYCNLPATTHAVWPRHDRQRTRLKRKHAPLSVCVCVVQPRVSNMCMRCTTARLKYASGTVQVSPPPQSEPRSTDSSIPTLLASSSKVQLS